MPYEKIIFVVLFLAIFFFKPDNLNAQNWDYSYTHFTKEDGLPSNIVYHLVNDNDGFIWLGTDAGLVRFDGSHFITYTTEDGLPSNDVLKLTCDSKNRVWINSMSKEICYYQNGKIHNKYNTPFLNKIEIKKQILDILEDKDSTIWITSEPYDIYKINKEKIVKESVNEQLNRSLNYNGKIYLFSKVKKKNNPYSDGLVILDDTIIYSIVKSYFWQTIWFKIIAILFFLLFIYIIFKCQIQKVKNNELKLREKDTKIHQLELSVWRSKINPHFLFNSLNSIVALINMNKYDNAVEYINDFSIVLRKTIQSSDKLFNIINEEIILIESLLKLEMMKRENKFYFSIKLGSPDIKYLFFPTLLIQPVIENSLKHGIKSNPNGKILISFYEHGDKIICTVEDNGDGINDKAIKNTSHRSMGINLIKDKIKIIEEIIHAKIEFIFKNKTDVNNTGTITIFVIPKITKEKYVTYNNS
jgi:hypothetical protein